MRGLLHDILRALLTVIHHQEKIMADYTKLNQDIADLNAKVDALLAKQAPPPPPPVDEQPAVDAADQAVLAIAAKIPA